MTVKELATLLLETCNHDAQVMVVTSSDEVFSQSLEDADIFQESDDEGYIVNINPFARFRSERT